MEPHFIRSFMSVQPMTSSYYFFLFCLIVMFDLSENKETPRTYLYRRKNVFASATKIQRQWIELLSKNSAKEIADFNQQFL